MDYAILRATDPRGELANAGYRLTRRGFDPCPSCAASEPRGACRLITYPDGVYYYRCSHCSAGGTTVDILRLLGRAPTAPVTAAPVAPSRAPSMPPDAVVRLHSRLRLDPWVNGWLQAERSVYLGHRALDLLGVRAWSGHAPTANVRLSTETANGRLALALPLRSPDGALCNLVVRPIRPVTTKTVLLRTGVDTARGLYYGLPPCSATDLLVVEGWADWLTAEALVPPWLPVVGVRCAGDITSALPGWLSTLKPARLWHIPHNDRADRHGRRAGQDAAVTLAQWCSTADIELRLWDWGDTPAPCDLNDLAVADLPSLVSRFDHWLRHF